MPRTDTATMLLNEEAWAGARVENDGFEAELEGPAGLEGEFDPDASFVQLQADVDDVDPFEGQIFAARQLVRPLARGPQSVGIDLFPTGVAALDVLLQGGIARGEMIEVMAAPGARTCGRFSTVLALLAMATHAGEQAALVDLGDHLDPQIAERTGVVLERLLWLRPEHMKQALGAAELLLTTGFPLVVLDLGAPPVPGGRGKEAAWLRLARAAQSHRGALFVSSPYRSSGTAATAVVEAARGRAAWWRAPRHLSESATPDEPRPTPSPNLLAGVRGSVHREKGRGRLRRHLAHEGPPGRTRQDVEEALLSGSFGLSLPSEGIADLDVESVAPAKRRTPSSWQGPRLVRARHAAPPRSVTSRRRRG